jgi:hypothetical protein
MFKFIISHQKENIGQLQTDQYINVIDYFLLNALELETVSSINYNRNHKTFQKETL